jgi:hypothetical protein
MKLNPSQIDRLYTFTRQHYVEYYDLQTELVDHLANGIETEWQENPKLTFEEILQKEFKKFGVFGFMDVVEKRQAVLGKKYNRLVWKHFKEFFTIPKIILTATLVLGLFLYLRIEYSEYFFPAAMLLLLIGILPFAFVKNRKMKQHSQKTGKTWLFEKMIFNYGSGISLVFLPMQFFNILNPIIFKINVPTDAILILLSVLTVSIYLTIYIVIFEIPKKAKEYLKQTYPEYDFAN